MTEDEIMTLAHQFATKNAMAEAAEAADIIAAAIRYGAAQAQAQSEPVAIKPLEWRCFHCDEVFTSNQKAAIHFGYDNNSTPACFIVGAAGSLIEILREAEKQVDDAWAAIHDECLDCHKAMRAQSARYQSAFTAAEELGYERGLSDGRSALVEPVKPVDVDAAYERAAAFHDDAAAEHEAVGYESQYHEMMVREHRRFAAAIRSLKGGA